MNHFDTVKLASDQQGDRKGNWLAEWINKIKNETKDGANRTSQMFNNYLIATPVRIIIFCVFYYIYKSTEVIEPTEEQKVLILVTDYVKVKTYYAVLVQIISGNGPIFLLKY